VKILILHNFYQDAGGEDTVFRQDVQELGKRHEVEVFTRKNSKGWKGLLQYLFYPFNLLAGREIAKRTRRFRPDVVHVHNLHYAIGPWAVRRLHKLGVPVVMTLHNYRLICPSATLFLRGKLFESSLNEDFPWTAIRKRALEKSFAKTFLTGFAYWLHRKIGTWRGVSAFIVLSGFAKRMFEASTFPVPAGRFVVKPNAMAVDRIDAERRSGFVYIGRLSEEKGIVPLQEAFAGLEAEIRIFGSGPLRNDVEASAVRHPNIRYEGFRDGSALPKALASAEALVVPSLCYEGMPMTIIEAFGQGTPVLASRIGILCEMVVPLQTGLHFDPHSAFGIREAVRTWQEMDIAQKERMRNNCRSEYEERYTLAEGIKNLEKIYREAIAERKNHGDHHSG